MNEQLFAKKRPILTCLSGQGHPAAEDCGGSGGWGHLKECFQKPETDSDNRQKWFKTACMNGNRKGLDPWKWDMREVNKQLEKKFKSDDQDDSSSGEDFW